MASAVDDPNDPFSLVRLDGDELSAEPSRLVDEAMTMPLFGGRRAIRVRAGSRSFASGVDTLAEMPLKDCRIVIEAGELRPELPLRKACERARTAVAIGCYPDEPRDLAQIDRRRVAGLEFGHRADARAVLASLLGGDRQASRNELRKLALYAHGAARGHARRCDGGGRRCLRAQGRSDRRRRLRRQAGAGRNRIRQGDGRRHLSWHDHIGRAAPGGVAAQIGARGRRGNAGLDPARQRISPAAFFAEGECRGRPAQFQSRRGWLGSSSSSRRRRWRCASSRRWPP